MRNYNPYDVMKRQHIDLYLRLLFLLLGTLAAILSLKTYISDSEFWAITASRQLGEAGASSSIYMKFLFYGLLKPIYALPLDNISHVLVARLEFAAIGAITAYVFYRVARLALDDEPVGLLLTLILATSTYFLSQSFRVRSDNLASLFALVTTWIVIRWSRDERPLWIRPAFTICFLNLLLLVTTPKSFYFLVIGGLFAATLPFHAIKGRKKALALGVAYVAPSFLIASSFQIAKLVPMLRWVDRATVAGLEYFFDSFAGLAGHQSYLSEADFVHVRAFVLQNPFHDLFFVATAIIWISEIRNRSMNRDKMAFFLLFVSSLALLVFHNQKLPFFIYSMLPLLFLGGGYAWRARVANYFSRRRSTLTLLSVLTIASIGALWLTTSSLKTSSNAVQLSSLGELERLLKSNPVATYYDAIGLFPRSNKIYAFPSPNDRNNPVVMKVVENSRPDVIFYVTRLLELEPRMGFFLSDYYVNIGGGVWLKAVPPKRVDEEAEHKMDGRCQLSSATLRTFRSEFFEGSIQKLMLFEVDGAGFVKMVADEVEMNGESISWVCGDGNYALSANKPLNFSRLGDLRFVFGFDVYPLR